MSPLLSLNVIKSEGVETMDKRKFIWIPRVLAIIFILFISVFALDALPAEDDFLRNLVGFFIHLMPSFLLLAMLIIFWKRPRYSGYVFLFLGIVFTLFFRTYLRLDVFLLISFPPLLIGILFIAAHFLKKGEIG